MMKRSRTQLLAACLLAALPLSVVGQVVVSQTDGQVTIGNGYMSRTFNTAGNQLTPGVLVNKRTATPTNFVPSVGSEEFSLNPVTIVMAAGKIDRTAWTVVADGYSDDAGSGHPHHALDGNANTWWHSHYGSNGNRQMPHYLQVTMPESKLIKSFAYTPRPGNATINGQVKGYRLLIGETESTLTIASQGDLPFTGEEQWVNLTTPTTGKIVRFEILSSHNGREFAAVADFQLATETQDNSIDNLQLIDRTEWRVSADSWCRESATVGEPKHIVDGNTNTIWHSWYTGQTHGTQGRNTLPYSFMIDLGREQTFRSFGYEPRKSGQNGTAAEYEFFVSNDSVAWTSVKSGTFTYTDGSQTQWVNLPSEQTARYVKFTIKSTANGAAFGSCAEFYLGQQAYVTPKSHFSASEMTIAAIREENIEDGKRVVFDMQPYMHTNERSGQVTTWDIDMVVEMKNNDHFLRKYLLIKGEDEVTRQTPIDYIEMESLGVENVAATNRWTHPAGSGGVGGMSAYTLTLGQPVYVEGLFMGSEFPQAENEIANAKAHTRYYSGKSLATLAGVGRVDANGYFRTWSNVMGASRSTTDLNVIRSDFFKYITSIAKPVGLRLQYNSWYDWMMRIDEEKINNSFREMELGFSQHGIRPMDSYVVDDGWNNYEVSDVARSGTGTNKTGFWEFNSKFPNGLEGASQIARRYGSDFGIWLGPRGGYNFNAHWGHLLERHGNGTYNRNSADAVTGDSVYIAKLTDFFLENQTRYGVNYWKLDGFSTVQPQPSTNGRYITGGKNGNYYFTEHWERWYNTFDTLYAEADQRGSKLWLNLTCYVNPSPWILQWSNSVWIQNSQDKGNRVVGGRTRQMDQFLSYRDDRYYDFIYNNQLQFPLANIFNHDPIYGQEEGVAANSMTDAEFRAYLYMMATRGTAFWEMLYSYNFMDEGSKWMINGEAINFIDKHYETLRNAKYFGQSPLSGRIYGYSCWKEVDNATDNEGIVSFRNPTGSTQTYTFTLDGRVGVPTHATNLSRSLVMSYAGVANERAAAVKLDTDVSAKYSYGDSFTVTLAPGEIRIWKFTAEADVQPAQIYTLAAVDTNKIIVKFDEPVRPYGPNFKVYEGSTLATDVRSVMLSEDYRTVTLTTRHALEATKRYTLQVNGLRDWNKNATETTSPVFFLNKDSVVLTVNTLADLREPAGATLTGDFRQGQLLALTQEHAVASDKYFAGKGSFSIAFEVNTTTANATLLRQGDSYSVSLINGKPSFKVGELTYTADSVVNDGRPQFIICTRENNGMLKIYINGQLQGTKYDAAHINAPIVAAPITLGSSDSHINIGKVSLRLGAYHFKQAAAVHHDNVQPHYLVSVTSPETATVRFTYAKDSTTTTDGTKVARVASGQNVTVEAITTGDKAFASYTQDGTAMPVADDAQTLSIVFTNVTADHNVVIEVKDITTGITAIGQTLKLAIADGSISVKNTEGATQLTAYTADGKSLGTAHGNGMATLNGVSWPSGILLVEVKTSAGKQVFKLTK